MTAGLRPAHESVWELAGLRGGGWTRKKVEREERVFLEAQVRGAYSRSRSWRVLGATEKQGWR